jgi:phage N-6-adenine-methyltransferase
VIFCWFTKAQAERLASECADADLRQVLERQIASDLIPWDEEPRTVLLEDHGDGLQMSAVAYFTDRAATEAADRWWRQILDETDEPTMPKQMPAQKPNRSKQDYCTPKAFLAAVRSRLQIQDFDIDLAATAENTVTTRFYATAQNSLIQPWTVGDGWNFLNPPFADLAPWVEKAWAEAQRGARTAVLVPAAVGSNWWRDCVHGKAHVLLLNGRITFVGETQGYPKDCCLLLYGPSIVPQYSVWTWTKQVRQAAA